jgi:hypothetical protein
MLAEKKMTGSHRGLRRVATRDWGMGETRWESNLSTSRLSAYLALHAPRSVAPEDFFSTLLDEGQRRCPEECVHESIALKILQILN